MMSLSQIQACDDTQALLKELSAALALTVDSVRKCAAIVRRLEEMGVTIEITSLPLRELRLIAHGQTCAELFIACGGTPLFDRTKSLPMPDQLRVAKNEPLKVMELDGDHRMVPPLSMSSFEVSKVFGRNSIRNDAEQISWMRSRQERMAAPRSIEPSVAVDKRRSGIVVGDVFIPRKELARYLVELG